MRDTQRERDRDTAEGEAGSMEGARCGTRSQVSRIRPWAEGGAKPLSHQGCPILHIFKKHMKQKFKVHALDNHLW